MQQWTCEVCRRVFFCMMFDDTFMRHGIQDCSSKIAFIRFIDNPKATRNELVEEIMKFILFHGVKLRLDG